MAPADDRRDASSAQRKDPVHQHEPDDVSHVMEGIEENPEDRHPPNAETVGVKRILRWSLLAAIIAMFVLGVVAFTLWG